MKIYEYQAKKILQKNQINIPKGFIISSSENLINFSKKIIKFPLMIKAQIKAGGRGKSGGIQIANSIQEIKNITDKLLKSRLITTQTGEKGEKIKKLLIEEKLDIKKELYLSLLNDINTNKILMMVSESGGTEIELLAKKNPEKLVKTFINPIIGIQNYNCNQINSLLKIEKNLKIKFSDFLKNIYKIFVKYDCSLLEINPLAITINNEFIPLDAKIEIDSNALFRQKNILKFRENNNKNLLEDKIIKYNLNYIKINENGNIGNMVNGAGLAMATMDIIKDSGAEPLNFLDVGGGANSEMIEHGFKIILNNKNIKAIIINIFGGILRCDTLAYGIVKATKKIKSKIPIIIRLEGTNLKLGQNILSESKLNFITANDLKDIKKEIKKIINN